MHSCFPKKCGMTYFREGKATSYLGLESMSEFHSAHDTLARGESGEKKKERERERERERKEGRKKGKKEGRKEGKKEKRIKRESKPEETNTVANLTRACVSAGVLLH